MTNVSRNPAFRPLAQRTDRTYSPKAATTPGAGQVQTNSEKLRLFRQGWRDFYDKQGGTIGGVSSERAQALLGAKRVAASSTAATTSAQEASERPSGGATTMKTVTVNIRSNPEMPQAKVLHDVKRAAQLGDVIGWNEIGPERYRKAIASLAPKYKTYFPKYNGQDVPNPISWDNKKWKCVDKGCELGAKGVKGQHMPTRYTTWVKLKDRETGEEVIRINAHLENGAFNGKPNSAQRKKMWNTHIMELKKLVNKFESKGERVVIGGDFNRDSYKVLGNTVAYDNNLNQATTDHGNTFDYLMHTKGRDIKSKGGKVVKGFNSDHNAVVATIKLT